jgi:hypothetical protein
LTIDRRTFLIGATGGALVLSGVAGERTLAWSRRRSVLRWAGLVSGAVSAKELGLEYLTRYPDEADSTTLVSRLSPVLQSFPLLTDGGTSAGPFHEGIRRDFLEGDVEEMGGWLLSKTELRLCALVVVQAQTETGASGIFPLQQEPDGKAVHWMAPRARFTLPSGLAKLEFELRSGAAVAQRVAVRIDGKLADELLISGPLWHPVRYPMRRREGPTLQLELETTPAWRPKNDFRTLGVGIDRDWNPT